MSRSSPHSRAASAVNALDAPTLSAVLLRQALDKLPASPRVLQRLDELGGDRLSGLKDYADAISMDAVVSARVLRVANSPFFGFAGKVKSVERAAAVLGQKELVRMTRAIVVATSFKTSARRVAQAHWKHSVRVAIASRALAKSMSTMHDVDAVWTPALMHDIGQLMFASMFPEHARALWNFARREGITIATAEQRLRYPAHDRLGELLCRKWELPAELGEVITGVHLAGGTSPQVRRSLLTRVIGTADVLVRLYEGGLNSTAVARERAAAMRLLACDEAGVDAQLRLLDAPLREADGLAAGFA